MVNIPLLTMDDYGLIEPTDVGTMTIDYDPKEDMKRRINRWDQEEVVCMLNLIKENNFVSRYSVIKMSGFLSQMMAKKGYKRTDKQIQIKLTTLRKNFLAFGRQNRRNGNFKECPFYKELCEVYGSANDIDQDDYDSQDEYLMRFPNDPIEWSKEEIQKMLNLIKSMKLKNELTLTFFSPVAVKMIAEAMQGAGFDRSTQQVKNALINLRAMYIDYKISCDNNENPPECMFYSCLDLFWGKEYKKCRLKERKKTKVEEIWSTEETIVLLTLIQDLNIVEEAYKNSEKAVEELRLSLAENRYTKTKQQIINRLTQLKIDFVNAHTSNSEADAVRKFPFYTLYKKLFEHQYDEEINTPNNSSDSRKNSLEYEDFCTNVNGTPQTHNIYWANEEVKLLLQTIQKITSKSQLNESLEDEKLQRLVEVLGDAGYHKTADQIKRKLVLLKNSYLKCNLDDSSEKDIFNCPFYNELHNIFHTPVSDERYEFIQNLLSENLDLSISKFSDHSYTNVNIQNGTGEKRVNTKVTVVPNKCIDNWFPVESITDDCITPSTLELTNMNGISNNQQEQVVEEDILATLPNDNDTKVEENCTIVEDQVSTEIKDVNTNEQIPFNISDIALDQEVETTNQKNDVDCSKIYKNERPDSQMSSELISRPLPTLTGDEDAQPPLKKSRITEDEKIGKNKVLLRPVDVNSTSLNIANQTNKYVRLIVANEPNRNQVNHITAHIEPMNINTAASSISSGTSSPVERVDTLKLAAEKILKEVQSMHERDNAESKPNFQSNGVENCSVSNNSNPKTGIEDKISLIMKDVFQNMMVHDELMQQKHHAWMEKQFEVQRRHDEEQKKALVKELQELRNVITVLLTDKKQRPANNQHP